MVGILVILTVAVFVTVGLIRDRRRKALVLVEGDALQVAVEAGEPRWVGGFKLPDLLSYHPGHTWVHWVSDNEAYVGVDDFARRLMGKEIEASTPSVGAQLEQGEEAFKLTRDGQPVWLMAPVGGEVVGVNPRLKTDPGLIYREPYGRGWICKIRSPRLFRDLGNLLSGTLARRWMEDTRDRFQHRLMLAQGSVIQDGGMPVEDLASALEVHEWKNLVDEFLGPRPTQRKLMG